MEIKYTLEILTKDIQDIEKLVANLQNSPNGSTLELDLALSKLRNVYDMLTEIRTDMLQATQNKATEPAPAASEEPPPAKEEPAIAEEKPVVAEEKPAVTEEKPVVAEEKPVVAEEKPAAVEKPAAKEEPAGTVAEKFSAESSINENMAGSRKQAGDSTVLGEAINSISRNIGINDRFLIIRELFEGDSAGFGKLIEQLDSAGDYQTASQLLQSHFEHAPDHDGISILSNLVKRRYNRN